MGRRGVKPLPIIDRLFKWIRVGSITECWPWTGAKTKHGYGRINIAGRVAKAHRATYRELVGNVPDDADVCHVCDNPPCCNPHHLFLGDARLNAQDMVSKGRHKHCVFYGERHPSAKLSAEQVERIRSSVEPSRVLSHRHGVSMTTIQNIRNGTAWRGQPRSAHEPPTKPTL